MPLCLFPCISHLILSQSSMKCIGALAGSISFPLSSSLLSTAAYNYACLHRQTSSIGARAVSIPSEVDRKLLRSCCDAGLLQEFVALAHLLFLHNIFVALPRFRTLSSYLRSGDCTFSKRRQSEEYCDSAKTRQSGPIIQPHYSFLAIQTYQTS